MLKQFSWLASQIGIGPVTGVNSAPDCSTGRKAEPRLQKAELKDECPPWGGGGGLEDLKAEVAELTGRKAEGRATVGLVSSDSEGGLATWRKRLADGGSPCARLEEADGLDGGDIVCGGGDLLVQSDLRLGSGGDPRRVGDILGGGGDLVNIGGDLTKPPWWPEFKPGFDRDLA